jgi:hypothetical protein
MTVADVAATVAVLYLGALALPALLTFLFGGDL